MYFVMSYTDFQVCDKQGMSWEQSRPTLVETVYVDISSDDILSLHCLRITSRGVACSEILLLTLDVI